MRLAGLRGTNDRGVLDYLNPGPDPIFPQLEEASHFVRARPSPAMESDLEPGGVGFALVALDLAHQLYNDFHWMGGKILQNMINFRSYTKTRYFDFA